MGTRFPFPGLPNGWYAVALSEEVRPGQIVSRDYFERKLIVARTKSGVLRVFDAFCPHMGAHLGKVGCVDGEIIRCGFHGFEFDAAGRCVATAYGDSPPAKARLSRWDVREQNGLVLVWFDPLDRPADWEVPELPDQDWTGVRWHRFRIATHPQETTENSVDVGHFTQLHGFVDGSTRQAVVVDGHLLTAAYSAYRPLGVPGLPKIKIRVDYDVKIHGLGYSQVDVRIDALKMELRVWVLPVPIDEENIDLVIGGSTPHRMRPFAHLARFIAHRIVCQEVGQDLDVWTYKKFVERPALAKTDGPIGTYRRYVRQFYAPRDSAAE